MTSVLLKERRKIRVLCRREIEIQAERSRTAAGLTPRRLSTMVSADGMTSRGMMSRLVFGSGVGGSGSPDRRSPGLIAEPDL